MYRASNRVSERQQLEELAAITKSLELSSETEAVAAELYLTSAPVKDRSKAATMATSCYAAGLITGEQRSQKRVSEAADVARLTIQSRWRALLLEAGFAVPQW